MDGMMQTQMPGVSADLSALGQGMFTEPLLDPVMISIDNVGKGREERILCCDK